MYSEITSGRVLNGELLYTKILKLICLHLPTDCFVEISPHSTGHIAWVLIPFCSLIYILYILLITFDE